MQYTAEQGPLAITTCSPHGLQVGDTIRLIDDAGTQDLEVLSVRDAHTFTVAPDRAAEPVFVFAMLNVSATQELAKQVAYLQSHIATLEDEMALLKAKLAHTTGVGTPQG
jgi:hypothetical protein